MGQNGQNGRSRRRFMEGRYGMDQLSRFLSVASCVVLLAALLTRSVWGGRVSALLLWAAIVIMVWCYWRAFSRKPEQRQQENLRYLERREKVQSWFRAQRDMFRQRKDYVFFRCPGCKSLIRVPRGKGLIRITCRRCGYSFEKKT